MSVPRIAVVTPYFQEPLAFLEQGHRSVLAQGPGVDHFLIADGHPIDAIDGWRASHVRLPRAHADDGNTPRGLGGLLARAEDYDFIAYLDADNWFHDGHLPSLVALWEQTHSPVCTSFRTFHEMDGRDLQVFEHDEDALRHVDTSCLLLHRSAYDCLSVWLDLPRALGAIGDRVFLAGILHRKLAISSTRRRSVAFRSRYRALRRRRSPRPCGCQGSCDGDAGLRLSRLGQGCERVRGGARLLAAHLHRPVRTPAWHQASSGPS